MVVKKRKYMHTVFGKKRGETFGNFYHFLSTSKSGAEQQARKKYKLIILKVTRTPKTITP